MTTKRRDFVGGASVLALLSGSSEAFAQKAQMVASAEGTDFEAALRSKLSSGDVLNWSGGNVRLKRPIVIDVTESLASGGVDLNGAKIIADFNDPGPKVVEGHCVYHLNRGGYNNIRVNHINRGRIGPSTIEDMRRRIDFAYNSAMMPL